MANTWNLWISDLCENGTCMAWHHHLVHLRLSSLLNKLLLFCMCLVLCPCPGGFPDVLTFRAHQQFYFFRGCKLFTSFRSDVLQRHTTYNLNLNLNLNFHSLVPFLKESFATTTFSLTLNKDRSLASVMTRWEVIKKLSRKIEKYAGSVNTLYINWRKGSTSDTWMPNASSPNWKWILFSSHTAPVLLN